MVQIMTNKFCEITPKKIEIENLEAKDKSNEHGALVSFCGNVRDNDSGKVVTALNYEIHPTAQKELDRIVEQIQSDNQNVDIAIAHRFGNIPIGETAFAVVVASCHRAEAFAVCSHLVESVKAQIPIWKNQEFSDGTTEWVNSP